MNCRSRCAEDGLCMVVVEDGELTLTNRGDAAVVCAP